MPTPEGSGIHIPTAEEVAALDPAVRAEMAAAYLGGLEPGRQPLGLFTELARLTVLSTVEFIPVRDNEDTGRPEVVLKQRPLKDWWPLKWHVIGATLLGTDKGDEDYSYQGPIGRLIDTELDGAVQLADEPHILRGRFAHGERGTESTLIHWGKVVDVPGRSLPDDAHFFDMADVIENPPEPGFIDFHDRQVELAYEAYREHRKLSEPVKVSWFQNMRAGIRRLVSLARQPAH
jgi:hypothetical protein